jgi:hypothetical protein
MPFTNREVAVIVANELNRGGRRLWFYKVERHIDHRRWIIIREDRQFDLSDATAGSRHKAPHAAGDRLPHGE